VETIYLLVNGIRLLVETIYLLVNGIRLLAETVYLLVNAIHLLADAIYLLVNRIYKEVKAIRRDVFDEIPFVFLSVQQRKPVYAPSTASAIQSVGLNNPCRNVPWREMPGFSAAC